MSEPAAPKNPFDLTGRIAVVTGGSRGIGLGMARGLARAGASLGLWSRDASSCERAAAELRGYGVDVLGIGCDVSREDDVVRATRATLDHFGRIDVGIANAGYGRSADALKLALDEWRRLLATNLDGAFLTFRELARHMVEREGGGKLVAISSISAISGTPHQPHYAAGKAGIEALVRSFAVRLARHDIQVNAVQPGWIVTDATRRAVENERFNDVILRRTPARRWGDPDDLAGIAVYLASDASRYHTGDTMRIDGGYAVF
jgi:NAD(P)-dependent dehydrogenase (short-subunit alcohol dehydrogenase family)